MAATLLWLPLAHTQLPVAERGLSFLDVIGRMADSSTRQAVDAELDAIGAGIRDVNRLPSRQFETFTAASLSQETIGNKIESEAGRFELAKVFRRRIPNGKYKPHPAWQTMIQQTTKGSYQLVPPESA